MDNRIKVWSYWNTEERPAIVNDCIASWERHLDRDKYEIIILSENTLQDYLSPEWIAQIPDFQSLHYANQCDFMRLSLLKFYGGVWMDSSIYLMQDLSFIDTFDRFYAPRFPVFDHSSVQTWFLVAPENNPNINKWLDLFIGIWRNEKQARINWYRVSIYSGLLMRAMTDESFRTYFRIYEAYISLYSNDADFRRNTPGHNDYGLIARFRRENLVKLSKAYGLLFLSKIVVFVTRSSEARDPLKLRRYANSLMMKKQKPSVSISKNGKVVLYKLNAADRQPLEDDFELNKELVK